MDIHISIAGDVDVATGAETFARVEQSRPDQGDTVTLDLSEVTFVDSSGIATLMRVKQHIEDVGGRLVLANPSAPVWRVLRMLGLTGVFSLSGEVGTEDPVPRPRGQQPPP
jgi:anti-anti-sigma factor